MEVGDVVVCYEANIFYRANTVRRCRPAEMRAGAGAPTLYSCLVYHSIRPSAINVSTSDFIG